VGRQTHLRRSLRTKSEAEAIRRHRIAVAELKAAIEAARREPDGSRKGKDAAAADVAADAAWWRAHLLAKGVTPRDAFGDEEFVETVYAIGGDPVGEETGEDGHLAPVYDEDRERRAVELVNLVTGRRVPVGTELERFLENKRGKSGGPLSSRYVSRIRRAVRGLGAWLVGRPGGDNIATVSRYVAGLYVEHLGRTCNTAQTATSLVTSLSSYWQWMVRRGGQALVPASEEGLNHDLALDEHQPVARRDGTM